MDSDGTPDGFRTPGYPVFIAFVFMLGGDINCVVAIQIVLAVLCLYLVYAICRMAGVGHKYAMFGAIMLAADVMTNLFTCYVLSDAYFVYFLIIAAYFLAKYLSVRKGRFFFLFVITLNYALLVRPILIYFNMLLCVLLVLLWLFRKIEFKHAAAALGVFCVVFCGWSYRNYLQNGVFEMSSVRNYNMMSYDGAQLRSDIENISFDEAREKLYEDFANLYTEDQLEGLSKPQVYALRAEVGRKYIKEHFGEYLIMNVKGLINTMLGLNRGLINEVVGSSFLTNGIAVLYFSYLVFVYMAYLVGWIVNIRRINALDLFILTVSGYCAVASASVGYPRFRVAFFGLITIGMVVIWKQTDALAFVRGKLLRQESKQ